MFNTIWSSNGDLDKYLDMSPEEKRAELTNWYDSEMVDKLADDELDTVIADDTSFFDEAAEDFEYNVAPMISSQVRNGLVFDENFNLVDPTKLLADANGECEIREDEVGELSFKEDGRKEFPLLGFSEDPATFVEELRGLGILDSLHNLYPDMDDEDFDDPYYWEDMIPFDWELLKQNVVHVKDLGNLGEAVEEPLDEAKSKNPTKLAGELEEIKDLADEYGREYFTQMPFTSFDNDPISIEYQYPEFFRVVKSFFKEMEILSPEELNDPDELDVQWDQGIDQHDWDVLMKVCDKLAQGKGTQIEKEYKTGYNSPLDDDEILAKREEESLHEDEAKGSPDVDGPDGHGGHWEGGWHYDENGHIYCYQLEDENGDILDSVGDFESAKYELKYNPDAVKIVLVKSKDESFRWFDDFEEVVWEKGIDESLFTEDVNEVRNLVNQYLMDDLFDWGDNLALKIHDAIPEYDPDWCNDDGNSLYADRNQVTEEQYVGAMLDLLFANAPRQESLEEEVINEARKFEVDNNFIYVGIGDDQHDIGEIWDDGTVELFDPERWSAEDRKKMLKDLKALGYYYCSFLDESLNEEEQFGSLVGENNAEDFLQYLHANDCEKTGYFGDEPVKIDYMGDAFEIHLYSQAADMTFTFYRDGKVEVTGYDDDGDTKTEFNEYFEDYASFVEWYKSNNISWGSDLGANLGEALNEDTVTWPWGDPESKLPKRDSKESESDIDKYL